MKTETEWSSRRARLCLKAGVTNLNAGTCSPVSRGVLDAVQHWHAVKAEDPVQFTFRTAPVLMEASRRELAAYLGCEARSLLLVNNSTFAVNTLARSLPWNAGDEIVMSDQEYHHYVTLWRRLARERGIVLTLVPIPGPDEAPPLTPAALVERFAAAVTPRTRALFVSHVTSNTGLRFPVKELCALAKGVGAWSLIDGAHAPGLVPVDLRGIDPDFYFANVHKWMMGATGAAFLYVRPALRAQVKPLVTTGAFTAAEGAVDLDQVTDAGPTRWCLSHEYQGTRDLVPFVVIPEVLRFLGEVPLKEVDRRTLPLTIYARNRLASAPLGFLPASPAHPELATCMVSFKAPAVVTAAGGFLADRAWAHFRQAEQFEVAFPHLRDGTPLLRVSCAWFNTTGDVDALAETLERLDWAKLRA